MSPLNFQGKIAFDTTCSLPLLVAQLSYVCTEASTSRLRYTLLLPASAADEFSPRACLTGAAHKLLGTLQQVHLQALAARC